MIRKLFFALFPLLSGCLESTPGTAGYGAIPPVVVNCHSAQSAFCEPAKAGSRVFVGLTSNSVSCGAYLLAQPGDQNLNQIFDAVGYGPVSVQGPFLVSTLDAWYDFGGVRIYDLPRQSYTACGFIDLNGDERWQVTEPLGTGAVTVGGRETLIDDWN